MQNFNIFPDTRLDALESCFFPHKKSVRMSKRSRLFTKTKALAKANFILFFSEYHKSDFLCIYCTKKFSRSCNFSCLLLFTKRQLQRFTKHLFESFVLLLNQPARKFHLNFFMLSLLLCTLKIYLIAAMNECCLS